MKMIHSESNQVSEDPGRQFNMLPVYKPESTYPFFLILSNKSYDFSHKDNFYTDELAKNTNLEINKLKDGMHGKNKSNKSMAIDDIFDDCISLQNAKNFNVERSTQFSRGHHICPNCTTYKSSIDDFTNTIDKGEIMGKNSTKFTEYKSEKAEIVSASGHFKKDEIQSPRTNPKYCELDLWLHEDYVKHHRSQALALVQLSKAIQLLNNLLKTHFKNKDGEPMLQYHIKRVRVFGSGHTLDKVKKSPITLLETINDISQRTDTCATGVYVSEDWDGILGLAKLGSRKSGLCNKKSGYVVTSIFRNWRVSARVHRTTTIHELGHHLGAQHDPEDSHANCSSYLGYVMSAISTQADRPINFMFSPCSLEDMEKLMYLPNRRTCLKESISGLCGNGIIEIGEECDSGFTDDPCCGKPHDADACKLRGECSPSQGSCCNRHCKFRPNKFICTKKTDCSESSHCMGNSSICPPPISINENRFCFNKRAVCYQGTCTKSVCEKLKKVKCDCDGENSCRICCKKSNSSTEKCQPVYFQHEKTFKNLPPGFGCENKKMIGVCQTDGKCHIILTVSPIINALQSLISGPYRENLKNQIFDYLESFVWVFGLVISLFSIISRLLYVDKQKIYKAELSYAYLGFLDRCNDLWSY
ncbi:Disintegrin and metalloproteinase domain-containing protein 10 [Thelohanellus kitauei]|uniref:Disintegrin and metalloproteinase domain-containing protein 10 n=1 Tax=Thelohanellus kitauei TaxID=669202 RepID=A0A0C2IDG7_THEKT|nr:Disintegrin and metalloproteinase domain-containing protein 10 [Thelohanellus kitauei]